METIDKSAVISYLAANHNILISKDDPIFAMLGINEYVLNHFHNSTHQRQQELLGNFQEALDHYAMAFQKAAQLKIGEEIKQHKGEIRDAYREADKSIKSTVSGLLQDLEEAKKEVSKVTANSSRWIITMTIANTFILAAVIVITGLFII